MVIPQYAVDYTGLIPLVVLFTIDALLILCMVGAARHLKRYLIDDKKGPKHE